MAGITLHTANISPFKAAQVVGITSAAFLSGYIASFSIVTVPAISDSPPVLKAKQWAKAYSIGAKTAPVIALFSGITFTYLALKAKDYTKAIYEPSPNHWSNYATATILVLTIVPFTLGIMGRTNNRIMEKMKSYTSSGNYEVGEDPELDRLLRKWRVLNAVRSIFPGLAALVGLWAVIS